MNVDFGKALNLLDATLEQLSKFRSDPQKIIHAVEKNVDGIEWEEKVFQEGDRCQVTLSKMNLQPLRYSTQLLTPLLPE